MTDEEKDQEAAAEVQRIYAMSLPELEAFIERVRLEVGRLGPLTEDQRALKGHIIMWGSDGYAAALQKLKGGWVWSFRSIKGPPTVFRTKKAAVASLEAYLATLRERDGQEGKLQALEELKARRQFEESEARP